ncbi:MAG: response regulator [FCB group bacterium]|nr:response regulator [FCB group bacterium]
MDENRVNNGQKHPSNRANILVVDDSDIIREMLVEILSDEGYCVETAVHGEEGAAMAKEKDYDAIICDVHMPRMNGLETVREVISAKPYSRIILTDSFPDKLAHQAREEGALCCLQKPFDVSELRGLIRQIIAGRDISVG